MKYPWVHCVHDVPLVEQIKQFEIVQWAHVPPPLTEYPSKQDVWVPSENIWLILSIVQEV